MAVAGLQNVSTFGPFFGDSQSPVSRRWADERGRPSTRASSLLQMWREIEGDHVVSQSHRSKQQRNGSDSDCLSISMSLGQRSDNGDDISEDAGEIENQTEHEDSNSIVSEQSSDLGEIERERVRQNFQEWMNTAAKGHSNYGFHLNNRSGPQCLGENECERVRVIREWAQMNTQQRSNHGSFRDRVAEVGSQIEQVRDGVMITHPEIGARRPIRRLCGRQTLLDLLVRAQSERKKELQGLSEQRPVSDFTHRNRIQALLRGRFLRNERMIPDERPSSMAATELGLLRQRHTVSDLREGFLSRLDSSASTSVDSAESDSSFSDKNNVESESAFREREVTVIHIASELESATDGNRSAQEFEVQVAEEEDPVLDEGSEQEVSLGVGSASSREEPVLDGEARQLEVLAYIEYPSSGHGEQINTTITHELLLEPEEINYSGPIEVYHENYELGSGASYAREVDGHTTDLQGNTDEEFDSQDASAHVEEFQESVIEIEHSAWQQLNSVAFTEWADGNREDTGRSWQETSANQWFQETSDNDVVEQNQIQESHEDWPSHDLQEAIDSWLDMPSGEIGAFGRIDTVYFPDDDNVHSIELRELFSRRRVSSLLRSSFRESLDQVLQSHVERLGQASGDWELDNTSSSFALIEQDQEMVNGHQTLAISDGAQRNPFVASQPLWDEELQVANWPYHYSNQLLGTEWEAINELRIDMARLQQRMNNMQSMLEACMCMQIELQRSVRQEVSAALNRSFFSRDADASQDNRLHHESQWDHVRKGICCLCCESKIDSLLYRCGHMCACSKCAENLVQCMGKCPMCQAPVVEVVRAYFVQ